MTHQLYIHRMSCLSGIVQVIFSLGTTFCLLKPLLILVTFPGNWILQIYQRQSVFCLQTPGEFCGPSRSRSQEVIHAPAGHIQLPSALHPPTFGYFCLGICLLWLVSWVCLVVGFHLVSCTIRSQTLLCFQGSSRKVHKHFWRQIGL